MRWKCIYKEKGKTRTRSCKSFTSIISFKCKFSVAHNASPCVTLQTIIKICFARKSSTGRVRLYLMHYNSVKYLSLHYTASVCRITDDPLRKFAKALIAIFSSSVKRLLNKLNLAEAADAIELIDELLFSLITNSCSLSDDGAGDAVRLKLNTGCGMRMSALSCE